MTFDGFPEIRVFQPKNLETLKERCKPWVGKRVTVRSWHENVTMRGTHPHDMLVGFVLEFSADIPESELIPL